MKNKKIFLIIVALLITFTSLSYITQEAEAATIYTWGSRGDTVKKIQEKLKRWGYMTGTVDGVYGYQTWEAVKYFQKKNGLTEDGVAGKTTLEALGIFEGTTTPPPVNTEAVPVSTTTTGSSRENDVLMLAKIISGEARGETYTGQVAVGAVVLNRVSNPSFPNSISGVIFQSGAFDAVKDGQYNMEPTKSALEAARDALNGWDPSGGAIYYWNPKTATNKWVLSIPVLKVIGNHAFGLK